MLARLFRRRPYPDDEDFGGLRRRRGTLSTRLAWSVLALGGLLILTRASLATVVQIHGDGMAPTIIDGDHVMLLRSTWRLQPGDLVIFAPDRPPPVSDELVIQVAHEPPRPGETEGAPRHADPDRPAEEVLRNTAVVDVEDLGFSEDNWDAVQERSGVDPEPAGESDALTRQPLRVGRVLAVPGDTVTFNVPNGALGLAVNGQPVRQEPAASIRLPDAEGERPSVRIHATAIEQLGEFRYPVLVAADPAPPRWTGMGLPDDVGPVEMEAEGYLILADNRDEGACCDSRQLGWVTAEQIRGELILRLGRRSAAQPEHPTKGPLEPPGARWLP